jgi:hypothetical protein
VLIVRLHKQEWVIHNRGGDMQVWTLLSAVLLAFAPSSLAGGPSLTL